MGKSLLEFPAGIAGALGGAKLADRLVAKPAVKKILEKLPAVLGKNPTLLLGIPGFLLGGALAGGLISGIWQKSTNGKIDNKQLAKDMFTGSVGM